jgi:hypothetical protein
LTDGDLARSAESFAAHAHSGSLLMVDALPAIYHKERLYTAMQRPLPGETSPEATWDRFMRDWVALQQGPFFPLWASATVDEILSALHERIVIGSLGRDVRHHT